MKTLYLSGYWEGGGVRYLDDPSDPHTRLDADWSDSGALLIELKQQQSPTKTIWIEQDIPETNLFTYEEAKKHAEVYAEQWGFELSESTEPWED